MEDNNKTPDPQEIQRHNADIDMDEGNMNHGTIGGSMGEMVADNNMEEKGTDDKSVEKSNPVWNDDKENNNS